MAFFFDICDYLGSNMIGVDTIEANCVNFEDMASTARETRNAYVKALNQYIKSVTTCDVDGTCDSIIQEKIYTDFWQGTFIDFYTKFDIFWNMLFCDGIDKKTGLEYQSMRLPTIGGGDDIDFDYVVDYGDGSFNMSNVIAYQDSMVKFMCDIKNIMVLIMGETFEETTFTEFYPIGLTPTPTPTMTMTPTSSSPAITPTPTSSSPISSSPTPTPTPTNIGTYSCTVSTDFADYGPSTFSITINGIEYPFGDLWKSSLYPQLETDLNAFTVGGLPLGYFTITTQPLDFSVGVLTVIGIGTNTYDNIKVTYGGSPSIIPFVCVNIPSITPTPTPTPTPTMTMTPTSSGPISSSPTPTPTMTMTPTSSSPITPFVGLAACDPMFLFNKGAGTYELFTYKVSTNTTKSILTPSLIFNRIMGRSHNKLWLEYQSSVSTVYVNEYNLVENPYSVTLSRTFSISKNGAGNAFDGSFAKSNTELIGFYGSYPSNFISIDITTNPAGQTDLWATPSNRKVQGNALYTTNDKVIYLNYTTSSNFYLTQVDYSTGTVDFDTLLGSANYFAALFVEGGGVYAIDNKTGGENNVYRINPTNTTKLTLVGSTTQIPTNPANSSAQPADCITLPINPASWTGAGI